MSDPVQTDLEDAIAAASIETEVFLDGKVELRKGDCRDVLRSIPDNSIDSVVTDPPYALVSIVKRFGGETAAPAKSNGATGVYARASAGFMGKTWDTGETAFAVDFWAEVLRVLKPGGHVVAFSGARTYHRMVCAIEDAGFEIRDQIMWVYGSGFPKSLDVSKAIDKAAGAEREVVGRSPYASNRSGGRDGTYKGRDEYRLGSVSDITAPTTEAAKQWRGWGTSLKPANEPICLARKPLIGTVAANVITHGTGALNIDGCRVEAAGRPLRELDPKPTDSNVYVGRTGDGGLGKGLDGGSRAVGTTDVGRFPANLIHDGSEEVVSMFPDAGASAPVLGSEASKASVGIITGERQRVPGVFHADTGSASRFFASFPIENEARCGLCNLLSGTQIGSVCECGASNAGDHSQTQSTRSGDSVRCGVAGLPVLGNAGSKPRSKSRARSAENHSPLCHPQEPASVPQPALTLDESKIAQNVRSAASLCNSCVTAIARSLAATLRGQSPEAHLSPVSISEHSKRILSRSLALHVVGRENTDITTTTENLKTLLGCVLPAIAAITKSEKSASTASIDSDRPRLHYSSKADADDRLGSKHPTVKPVDLMQYLVRLVTRKGGTVLDPFSGTGTTGEAAWREGMRAILIEREPEYQADISRRMELAANPTKRAAVAKTKNNLDDPNDLPLFSGSYGEKE